MGDKYMGSRERAQWDYASHVRDENLTTGKAALSGGGAPGSGRR